MLIRIVNEVKKCVENECFIAALALAITIPDICGKAEYPDAGVTERYIKWYNNYIGKYETSNSSESEDLPYSSGEVIYNLRNSLLHQGNPNIESYKIKEDRCRADKFRLTISDVCDGGLSQASYVPLKDEQGQILRNDKGEICFAIKEKSLEVNVINLCSKLCRTARGYYVENKEKFSFFDYELHDIRHQYDSLFTEVDNAIR